MIFYRVRLMCDSTVDQQIIEFDKHTIRAKGYADFLIMEMKIKKINDISQFSLREMKRLEQLKAWAIENNFLEKGLFN